MINDNYLINVPVSNYYKIITQYCVYHELVIINTKEHLGN